MKYKLIFLFIALTFILVFAGGVLAVGIPYNCSSDSTMLGCWHFNDFNSITNVTSDESGTNNLATLINGTATNFNVTGGYFGFVFFAFLVFFIMNLSASIICNA